MATTSIIPRHKRTRNLSQQERIASAVGGGSLIAFGLGKRSLAGFGLAAIGGGLLYRGLTGHCGVYEAFGIHTRKRGSGRNVSVPYELGVRVDSIITIAKTPQEVYRYWRNLENLPRFMRHLESVREIDNKHSLWVVKAPAGRSVEWKAEIINEVENHLIGWRSLPGSDVDNAGSVHFKQAPEGRGTEVKVELQYNPPGGAVGAYIAKLFGEEPSQQISDDLRRLKQILETGEVVEAQKAKSSRVSGWDRDAVGQSSEESFPASDPPSWTPEALAH